MEINIIITSCIKDRMYQNMIQKVREREKEGKKEVTNIGLIINDEMMILEKGQSQGSGFNSLNHHHYINNEPVSSHVYV